MPDKEINKSDLYLLLDSYKNNVELSTVIMEQLRQIATAQASISDQCRDSSVGQKEINDHLLALIKTLAKYSEAIEGSNSKVYDKIVDFEKGLSTFEISQDGAFSKVGNKINLVYLGMGTLVASLLGIIYLLVEKLHMLGEIAEKVGIGSNIP